MRSVRGLLSVGMLLLLQDGVAGQLNVVVNNTEGMPLPDAVVYLMPRTAGVTLPAPAAAQIDQKDRMFVPAVSVVQTGTAVSFPNSDNIRHQVYSFSPAKAFNLKLYSGKPSAPVVFDRAGQVVMGCNIHDQMVAWVLVVDSAWFGKTGADGKVTIKNVPDDNYELRLWHPGQRREVAGVAIKMSGELSRTFSMDAAAVAGSHMHSDSVDH